MWKEQFGRSRRTSAWFYLTCDTYSDDEWCRNFRIFRNTFHFLVDELRMDIIRQDNVMRKAVEVRKKITLFPFFIASTDGYRSLTVNYLGFPGHLFLFAFVKLRVLS